MEEKEVWNFWHKTSRTLWEVSDQGNVKKNGELYECRLNNGYKVFGGTWTVHRAIAKLFVPNPNNYNEVDHINGNKLDNRAINLRWCTHKENINNPITLKRRSESQKIAQNEEETRKKISEAHKDKHRVYHDDGTWHMEKINKLNNKQYGYKWTISRFKEQFNLSRNI